MITRAALHEFRGVEHLSNGNLRSANAHFARARALAFGSSVPDAYESVAREIISWASQEEPVRSVLDVERGIGLLSLTLKDKFPQGPPSVEVQGYNVFFLRGGNRSHSLVLGKTREGTLMVDFPLYYVQSSAVKRGHDGEDDGERRRVR
jgi:hypothetical protein